MNKYPLLSAIVGSLVLTGCANEPDEYDVKEYSSIANPAAVYCVQQGGELDTVSESNQRITYCALPDGSRVEQWQLYRSARQPDNHS